MPVRRLGALASAERVAQSRFRQGTESSRGAGAARAWFLRRSERLGEPVSKLKVLHVFSTCDDVNKRVVAVTTCKAAKRLLYGQYCPERDPPVRQEIEHAALVVARAEPGVVFHRSALLPSGAAYSRPTEKGVIRPAWINCGDQWRASTFIGNLTVEMTVRVVQGRFDSEVCIDDTCVGEGYTQDSAEAAMREAESVARHVLKSRLKNIATAIRFWLGSK